MKSPGPDGLGHELYMEHHMSIAPLLSRVLNALMNDPNALRNRAAFAAALITLLPKTGDLTEPNNWRPISLLNANYKILTAIMAWRLKQALGSIIGQEQAGFSLAATSSVQSSRSKAC